MSFSWIVAQLVVEVYIMDVRYIIYKDIIYISVDISIVIPTTAFFARTCGGTKTRKIWAKIIILKKILQKVKKVCKIC